MGDFVSRRIVARYEDDLEKFGDTFQGVGWTKKKSYADLRYRIMLEGIRPSFPRPLSLLDFGCGASHLYEYMLANGVEGIDYSGLDLSEKYLALCRTKFPSTPFYHADILDPQSTVPTFDFIIMNGIFTCRASNSYDDMWEYFERLVRKISNHTRFGFAFNVMTKHLDWERDDLFHVSLDNVALFLDENVGRNFTIRHDYGLYEYTVYVYKSSLADEIAY